MSYINLFVIKNSCYCLMPRNYKFCTYTTWKEPKTAEFIINDYEIFFGKKFNKEELGPLLNCFVVSSEIFENIMKWIVQLYDKLYPWCVEPPNYSYKGHIGNIYERIMAYAISQCNVVCKEINVEHGHNLKQMAY